MPRTGIAAATFVVAALALEPSVLAAQESRTLSVGDRFVGGSAGYSWYSPRGSDWGIVTDRRVLLTELRAEWVLETAGPLALAASLAVVPLAVVQRTTTSANDCWRELRGQLVCVDALPEPAFGAGVMPVGMKLYLRRQSPRIFGAGGAGIIVFSRDVPVSGSRRFNYTFEYGGGVEIPTGVAGTVVVGYKFHHISNGYTSPRNPGLDANVLYLGFLRRRR